MTANTIEIIDRGLKCLSDNIGAKDTELFISTLLRERFDYTSWRRVLTDNINTFEELDDFIDRTEKRYLTVHRL